MTLDQFIDLPFQDSAASNLKSSRPIQTQESNIHQDEHEEANSYLPEFDGDSTALASKLNFSMFRKPQQLKNLQATFESFISRTTDHEPQAFLSISNIASPLSDVDLDLSQKHDFEESLKSTLE